MKYLILLSLFFNFSVHSDDFSDITVISEGDASGDAPTSVMDFMAGGEDEAEVGPEVDRIEFDIGPTSSAEEGEEYNPDLDPGLF